MVLEKDLVKAKKVALDDLAGTKIEAMARVAGVVSELMGDHLSTLASSSFTKATLLYIKGSLSTFFISFSVFFLRL